jgi:hypothetical protein
MGLLHHPPAGLPIWVPIKVLVLWQNAIQRREILVVPCYPSTKLSAAMCMGRDPSLNTMCMYDGFFANTRRKKDAEHLLSAVFSSNLGSTAPLLRSTISHAAAHRGSWSP